MRFFFDLGSILEGLWEGFEGVWGGFGRVLGPKNQVKFEATYILDFLMLLACFSEVFNVEKSLILCCVFIGLETLQK